MKLIVIFGPTAGVVLALGNFSAAGQALLALTLAYGLTALPWLLAVLFALLWLRQRDIMYAFREGYLEKIVRPTPRRKRAPR
jgi:hypothetical protein